MSFPPYASYKVSGVEWLGEVPSHWRVERLKLSVENCRNGIWGQEADGGPDDIPCVRVADFDRVRLGVKLEEPTIRSISERERQGRVLRPGDLLLEKSGGGEKQPVGAVVLYGHPEPAVCSNFVARMRLAPAMHARFWTYVHSAAYAVRLTDRSINQTSGIQNLDQSAYFEEPAPYPPLEEQAAIAAFLDRETAKIDALVEAQRRSIALLKEKRQAVISHAVTKGLDLSAPLKFSGSPWLGDVPAHWAVRSIGSCSDKITNGYVGPTREILRDSGVRYLQSLHIKNGKIIFDQPYFVSAEWSEEHGKSILSLGDVLIVQTGDIGQVACVTEEFCGCNCHALIIASPSPGVITGSWLELVLRAEYGRNLLLSIQTGALHPHLNCGNVKFINLPVPPLSEQDAILETLTGQLAPLDALISEAEAAVPLLSERRAALISASVTGKIDVSGLAAHSEAAEAA